MVAGRSLTLVLALAAFGSAVGWDATPESSLAFIRRHNQLVLQEPAEATTFTIHEVNELRLAATGLIRLYQLFISPQDMPACNFTPTCSRFGMAAIRRYGVLQGGLMTADHLLRCHPFAALYHPEHPVTGKAWDLPEDELPWHSRTEERILTSDAVDGPSCPACSGGTPR